MIFWREKIDNIADSLYILSLYLIMPSSQKKIIKQKIRKLTSCQRRVKKSIFHGVEKIHRYPHSNGHWTVQGSFRSSNMIKVLNDNEALSKEAKQAIFQQQSQVPLAGLLQSSQISSQSDSQGPSVEKLKS